MKKRLIKLADDSVSSEDKFDKYCEECKTIFYRSLGFVHNKVNRMLSGRIDKDQDRLNELEDLLATLRRIYFDTDDSIDGYDTMLKDLNDERDKVQFLLDIITNDLKEMRIHKES